MAISFRSDGLNPPELTIGQKLVAINWLLVLLVVTIAGVGCLMLYSAANGSWSPWAYRHVLRFSIGLGIMLAIALVDIRFWMRTAYLGYMVALLLLVAVEIMGEIGMGAQRWIDLGLFQLQPSEVMKICLVLALARYFNGLTYEEVGNPLNLIIPLLMVGLPAMLVLKQPDLGTALMMIAGAGAIFFLAGVRIWKFLALIAAGVAAVPIVWQFLREYQQKRILTFLNPESDPLGSGYHILQSKIALGSGGIFGKGFLKGSQSHLNFLPEKQTDFIFTMLAEEFGMIGASCLIGLYVLVLAYGFAIAIRSRSQFGRLVALGVTTTLFLYLFINVAMVMGLIPVVGVPLPMISYGGTAMLTMMIGLGLLLGVSVHRDVRIARAGVEED
ncbi:rod shape-determining protein RodA [Thalassobaculum sp. OXR-137]|uniref:rod shape-determining protein RodA n=1 Tax=Thalassobaculum sp. OXR-137 TaxID=3100173 RepID=UPI002AC93F62|nr:rod shape-determining protein RodA [Thalassobaculum sp. OXR-137]WPZ34637.1 rod shape-determining protein RodA [Thalassobaculum sp. OXR-137]